MKEKMEMSQLIFFPGNNSGKREREREQEEEKEREKE